MNKEVSSYLDCVRLLAAVMVMLCHVELNWVPGVCHFLIPLGNESLAVLFVLSGFLIGYVSDNKETTLKSYLIHRAARVYSVTIPCILAGFLLDSIGKHLMPNYYVHGSWPPLGHDLHEFLIGIFSLTFLNEVWSADFIPGSMAPFWTMPYEITYYLVFGTAWYLRGWWRLVVPVALSIGAGPEIMEFFPLWLIGMGTYRLFRHFTLSVFTGRVIFITSMLILIVAETIGSTSPVLYGQLESPYTLAFYLVGALFGVITLGFCFADFSISRYTGAVRWLAGATFTLYLLHFPLGRFVNGLVPFYWHPIARWPLIVFPIIGVTLILAQYTERRKEAWRGQIERGVEFIEAYFQHRKLLARGGL